MSRSVSVIITDDLDGSENAETVSFGFRGVKPARDPDRAVRQDAPLNFAGGLLRPDQDDPQRPASFGDVEQDLLDRAVAFTRRVLVQLVEDDKHQRPRGALALLAGELAPQRDADDEPLCPVGQVVQVDDGDLGARGGDGPLAAVRQHLADLDAQLAQARPYDVNNPDSVGRYKALLQQRDAAYQQSLGPVVTGAEQATARYNSHVAQYNAQCASHLFNADVMAQLQSHLSCPPLQ